MSTRTKQHIAALHYARLGWRVFPLHEPVQGGCSCGRAGCGNAGKHPRTRNGFKDASNDPAIVEDWWDRWPSANIGIATGEASGLVVLDIDPRNDGGDSLSELEKLHGALPEAPTVQTGGGGQHYYFSRPTVKGGLKGRSGYRHGIDIKSDGGYVVAPPSLHASGQEYTWDAGAHISDVAPAVPPEWLDRSLVRDKGTAISGNAPAADSYLGRAFIHAGWAEESKDGSRLTVRCPWEDEHSSGSRYDSSTIIFPASAGREVGWFHCSHAHCSHKRSLDDVIASLPTAALDAAAAELEHPAGWRPGVRREAPPAVQPYTGDQGWEASVLMDSKGVPKGTPGNVALVLANRSEWAGCLVYDAFRDRVTWDRPAPPVAGLQAPVPGEVLTDHHTTYVAAWLGIGMSMTVSEQAVSQGIASAARYNERHGVREYLQSLTWDGTPRISDWLTRYCGARSEEYERCIGRWWLISAVARIMNPGAQVDHMLILEGDQAARKSTTARILGGEWYSGELPSLMDAERAGQAIQGAWIIEAAELDALQGAHAARVKDFLTKTSDRYRAPWTRHHVDRPRQCVFIGTTNEGSYISDPTGARRYWPVRVEECDTVALAQDRDQLWAEAVHAWSNGEAWWPERGHTVERQLKQQQRERQTGDVWEQYIGDYVRGQDTVTTADILTDCLGIDPGKQTKKEYERVNGILRLNGWHAARVTATDGSRRRGWKRPL